METKRDEDLLPIYHNLVTFSHIKRPLHITYAPCSLFLTTPSFGKTRLRQYLFNRAQNQ